MHYGFVAGDTSKTIYVRLRDSTTGLAKTGLAFNTSGILLSYTLPLAARAAITPASQTVTGAWTSGGFVEVDATNCKGLYRLDLPDAAIASGAFTIISVQFTGVIEESIQIELNVRKVNVTQLLGTAWLTPGTAGTPDVNVKLWNALTTVALPLVPTVAGRTLDVSAGGEAGLDWANIGSPTTTVGLSGTTVGTVTTYAGNTLQTVDAATMSTRVLLALPAVAPGNNGGLPTGDASNRFAGIAGTKHTFDDLNDLSQANVRTATGLGSANLDTQLAALATAAALAALQLYTTHILVRCTASGVPTTTSIPTSACAPAGAVADQFKGRIITFDHDTTTAALRGQSTDITASSNSATPTFTVTALTTAPVSGDLFTIA